MTSTNRDWRGAVDPHCREVLFRHQPGGEFVHATNLRHFVRTPRTLVRSSLVAEPVRTNSDEQRRRIAYETRRRESGLQAFPLNRHFSLQAHTARRGKTTEKPYVMEIAAASWLKIYRESCWICFLFVP